MDISTIVTPPPVEEGQSDPKRFEELRGANPAATFIRPNLGTLERKYPKLYKMMINGILASDLQVKERQQRNARKRRQEAYEQS